MKPSAPPHSSGMDPSMLDPGSADMVQTTSAALGSGSSRRHRDPDSGPRSGLKSTLSTSHRTEQTAKQSGITIPHGPENPGRAMRGSGSAHNTYRSRSRSGRITGPAGTKHQANLEYSAHTKLFDMGHKRAVHGAQQPQPAIQTYGQSPSESVSTTTDSREHEHHRPLTAEDYSGQIPLGRLVVDIVKGDESSLGLTVSSGTTEGEPPIIASIRPGSIADRSDCLLVDDRIIAINNNYTTKLRHEDNVRLAKSAGPWIRMELEYELPDLPPAGCTVKHMIVDLETHGEGSGLVVRGGWNRLPSHIRPLTVMHIREKSISACDGRIKPGDRILAINYVQTGQLTCEEAIKLIAASRHRLTLVVEYNVANFETDRSISGAVMVEIEKPGNEDLGICLAPCHEVKTGQNAFFINHIRQGSIGDRCGALFVGDRVEAIDDIHVEDLTLQEAMHRLKHNGLNSVRLQIVPNAITDVDKQSKVGTARSRDSSRVQQQQQHQLPPWKFSPPSMLRTRSRSKGQRMAEASLDSTICACEHEPKYPEDADAEILSGTADRQNTIHGTLEWNAEMKHRSIAKSLTSLHSLLPSRPELCRCEEVEVRLEMDDTYNYGISICASGHSATAHTQLVNFPLIEHVEPGSVAYKSGVIQEGDRVITMNGQSTLNRTVEELTVEYLRPDPHRHRGPLSLTLVTQYSVADTVVPSSGVFDVKLVRRAANLGINLQASITKQDGQPLLISKVIPGSVASRSGSISPGDILLAVNGVHLSSCSLSEAIRLLQSPAEEIVTLRIQKIADTTTSPNLLGSSPSEQPSMVRSVSETTGHARRNHYSRSDSVPESQLGRDESIRNEGSVTTTTRHKSEPEVDLGSGLRPYDRENLKSEPSRLKSTMPAATAATAETASGYLFTSDFSNSSRVTKTHISPGNVDNHIPTDRSTPSGQEERRLVDTTTLMDNNTRATKPATVASFQEAVRGDAQTFLSAQDSFDNRSRLISSPEDMSQDDGVSVVRVTLRRKSAECPWGIIICGTDEASNAPVFVDSLTPGDPGAASGLLFPGDRILAINGNALHAGHTLTQAMRMLQRYPDRVVLHVARQHQHLEPELGRSPQSLSESRKQPEIDSRIHMDEPVEALAVERKDNLTRKPSLKKVAATSTFSRSFDSITNSVGTGVASSTVMEVPPSASAHDAMSAISAPAGAITMRPKSTPAECYPSLGASSGGGAGSGTTSMTRSFGAADQELIMPKRPDDLLDASWFAPTRSFGTVRHPGPQIMDHSRRGFVKPNMEPLRTRELPTAPDPMLQDWIVGEQQQQYSGTSEGGDTGTDVQDHPEFYPTLTNYNDLDLDSIQCPGCREAILNELRQQKAITQRQLARQHYVRKTQLSKPSPQHHPQQPAYQQPYRQRHGHRRTRSHQRSAASSSFEGILDDTDKPITLAQRQSEFSGSTKPLSQSRNTSIPKALFYCPELELPSHSRTLVHPRSVEPSSLLTRHSKSDSRLNLTVSGTMASNEAVSPQPDAYCTSVTPSRKVEQPEGKSHSTAHRHLPDTRLGTHTATKRQSGPSHSDSIQTGSRGTTGLIADRSAPGPGRPQVAMQSTTQGRDFVTSESSVAGRTDKQTSRLSERGVWCTWIRLTKASAADSYGIGVSEGLSTRGIFVSAIRPNSSADRSGQLHLYDRILMVNDVLVEDLSCSEVVGLISQSEKYLDLLIQRRIARPRAQTRDAQSGQAAMAARSMIQSTAPATTLPSTIKSPPTNRTMNQRKKPQASATGSAFSKRSQHTNLTVL